MAHLSVMQRSPLRYSLSPSRRHCLHCGDVSLAISRLSEVLFVYTCSPTLLLHAASLLGATSVVRGRCIVLHAGHFQACGLQCADSRLSSAPGTLHMNLNLLQPMLHAGVSGTISRHLSSKRGRFPGTLETSSTGIGQGYDLASLVRQSDQVFFEGSLMYALPETMFF